VDARDHRLRQPRWLELGFGSDLDLVFLHDNPAGVDASDGARPLEPGRWYARLAQKVMALLGAVTAAGRLYDIDVRLRPDGGKGSLVSSLASYTEYQRERAWTWEHQALVRAWRGWRCQPAGRFEQVRAQTLGRERDGVLYADVLKMRGRMRTELDRSDAARLDLKQCGVAWWTWSSCCRPACWRAVRGMRRCCSRAIRRR
jgi:glutamate-ammonia-ligase adenylyltransferase